MSTEDQLRNLNSNLGCIIMLLLILCMFFVCGGGHFGR